MPTIGEIRMFAGSFAPQGWAFCDGSLLPISENDALFNLIGTTYGGDGEETFGLPDLRGRAPVHAGTATSGSTYYVGQQAGVEQVTLSLQQIPGHTHVLPVSSSAAGSTSPLGSVPAVVPSDVAWAGGPATELMEQSSSAGGSQAHDNMQPSLCISYIISLYGVYPSPGSSLYVAADHFVGEIRAFGFNFAPAGWATCSGQLMAISQNTALFSLLGTSYGGDGKVTFAFPNLETRVPIGWGEGPGLAPRWPGEEAGSETVTLLSTEIPAHTHAIQSAAGAATTATPVGNVPATSERELYAQTPSTQVPLAPVGGNQPHDNMQPYLTITYCVALTGIFPPRG